MSVQQCVLVNLIICLEGVIVYVISMLNAAEISSAIGLIYANVLTWCHLPACCSTNAVRLVAMLRVGLLNCTACEASSPIDRCNKWLQNRIQVRRTSVHRNQ